ncbi:MAG: glycosyltransferase family 2 protein [Rhodanobacteraceae bacterium]
MAAGGAGLTSVVIVAANSGPLLADSVAGALASDARVEIIVVDNASHDGEPERVASLHREDARFRLLGNERNLGFGPACNRGAALAHGDALLFLNPDCVIERGTIAALRAIADADASIGVLGIEILSPDGAPARGNRRRDPMLRRALMSMSGLSRFESRSRTFEGVEMRADSVSGAHVEKLDAVSGACLFLPRRVFDAVGGFDEAYFLHVEDLDLCRRVRDAGYAVALAHGVHAMHVQGTSSRRRPLFVAWHKHRGMWRWFTRFDPAARSRAMRMLVAIGLWTHFALTAPLLLARQLAANSEHAKKETPRTT